MNKIICALDTDDLKRAIEITKLIKEQVWGVKIGMELFYSHGVKAVEGVAYLGVPIFLDLKLHDIPNTVHKALKVLRQLPIKLVTIHLSGGRKMIEAAAEALVGSDVKLVGVTALTSLNAEDLKELNINIPLLQYVKELATLGAQSGVQGLVLSAQELKLIRPISLELTLIVPGTRVNPQATQDQSRVLTPKEALALGADYLVIGRELMNAPDPLYFLRSADFN